jgi:hypothetical protein
VLPNLSRRHLPTSALNNRLKGFRDPQNRPLNSGVLDGDGLWDLEGRTGKGTPMVYSGNGSFGPPEGHRRILTRGMPSPR